MRSFDFILSVFTGVTVFLAAGSSVAQDLSSYDIMDNESVGLPVTAFEKGGLALADIDRNGYPDIFCLRWASPGYSRIYLNNGGHFIELTTHPLEQIEANEKGTRTTLWVDYDNDGDKDLSLATTAGIHLLRNDHNVFTEVSAAMGFVAPKPAGFIKEWDCNNCGWSDYDQDGDLDCVISQLSNPNLYLFRNDGDHFTNVATQAGLDANPLASEWRVVFTDFDLDGWPDLVGRNSIFRNVNGHFVDVTAALGLANAGNFWYKYFFDYDNDGDLDFLKLSRLTTESDMDELWENRDGVYYNVSNEVGFISQKFPHRGMTVGDFDNDGDQDIFMDKGVTEAYDNLFVNDENAAGEHSFADVAEYAGITKTGNRKGCGFFDYNRDGFLDIYMPTAEFNHLLYRNTANNGANWIGFILEGTVSNRDAVNSLITLYTGNKKQIRLTRCGDDHFHQFNPWVHFGIGLTAAIDSVIIRWPLGYRQKITAPVINQYHEVKEPAGTLVNHGDPAAPVIFRLQQNYPNPFNPVTTIRYELSQTQPVTLTIHNMRGEQLITLVDHRVQTAGFYTVTWDYRGVANPDLSTGIYLFRLQAGETVAVKKMTLMK
jgi:hypothetical protein